MNYYPQLKTTQAEMKAIHNIKIDQENQNLIPIIQLTKPRISETNPIEALERHIKRSIEKIGKKSKIIIGITTDETYQDANLNQYILDYSDGYKAWRNRLEYIKDLNENIIPCVIGYPNADVLPEYIKQIKALIDTYPQIAVKIPVTLEDDFRNLHELINILELPNKNDYYIFDYGYIKISDQEQFKANLSLLSSTIQNLDLKSINIPIFSSCPASFPMGKKESNRIEKIQMIEYKIAEYINSLASLQYGDYGYIHPERQEGGGFWYPRIDYPSQKDNKCFYSRYINRISSRENGKLQIFTTLSNEEAYRELSKTMIAQDFFSHDSVGSWGRKQLIKNTTDEELTGKSPQHYIAIRSNIHMEQIRSMLKG